MRDFPSPERRARAGLATTGADDVTNDADDADTSDDDANGFGEEAGSGCEVAEVGAASGLMRCLLFFLALLPNPGPTPAPPALPPEVSGANGYA
mmetsp:Transcript_98409/g.281458  ORF Transcript_98409/g.281458 Transcript_98409/m.281458 type:complete len:94 (+) Transcript_98409:191-472(+)